MTEEVEDDEPKYDINEIIYLKYEDSTSVDNDPFAKEIKDLKTLSGITPVRKRAMTRLEKKFEGTGGAKSKQEEIQYVTGYNAFKTILPPYNQDYLAKLYEKSPWHAAAVDAKVANIVGLGYDLIPSPTIKNKMEGLTGDKADKQQKKLSRLKQEFFDVLDDLNKEDTFQEILEKVWQDFECTGNGYLEIGRTDTGQIGYLGHIPAPTIRVRRDRDGFVQIIANKAVFFRNFGADDPNPIGEDQNPNEIIHFKNYSPSNTYYGVPDIISASVAVAGNDAAGKFNLDYFENKAVPRHAIILQGATLNPKLAKNLLEFFETGIRGKNHRSIFIPLPASSTDKKIDIRFEAVEAGTMDASFINYKAGNVDEILAANGVPITKVSLAKNAALALARDADKTFKEQKCQPRQRRVEKKVNKVIREMTDMFVLDLNELTLTDAVTQANIDQMRRKSGTETANEQRVRDGKPTHPDGDKLDNMIPANNAADPLPPASAAAPGGKTSGSDTANRARDGARAGTKTDSQGEGRNPKGEGRTSNAG